MFWSTSVPSSSVKQKDALIFNFSSLNKGIIYKHFDVVTRLPSVEEVR